MGDFNVDLHTDSPNDPNRQQVIQDFLASNGDLRRHASPLSDREQDMPRWDAPLGTNI